MRSVSISPHQGGGPELTDGQDHGKEASREHAAYGLSSDSPVLDSQRGKNSLRLGLFMLPLALSLTAHQSQE